MVGKRGLEPLRLPARDPKSRSSTNSDTSPPGGPPRTRTWNLAIKSRLLCQIELVARVLAAHLVRFAKYITAQIGEATWGRDTLPSLQLRIFSLRLGVRGNGMPNTGPGAQRWVDCLATGS